MIKNFRDKETERLFHGVVSRNFATDIQPTALRKLWMLDAAVTIQDLKIPPANHLEKLKGKRRGQYSIRINDKWRICFIWFEGDAYKVEIVDYH